MNLALNKTLWPRKDAQQFDTCHNRNKRKRKKNERKRKENETKGEKRVEENVPAYLDLHNRDWQVPTVTSSLLE